ncbi:MAG: hypothetical protein U0169_17340 [Polyangiaceae bacterium]
MLRGAARSADLEREGASAGGGAGGGGGTSATDGVAGSSPDAVAVGIPCEVATTLKALCQGCHGTNLRAPMALLSYANLVAPSKSDPSKSNAVLALERMTNGSDPMPPSEPFASADQIASFRAWVESGTPQGKACGGSSAVAEDGGSSVTEPPVVSVCTSARTWSSSRKGATMNPGRACISCHESRGDDDDEAILHVGGTVYPTVREPDLCYGVDGTSNDVKVVLTDATGRVVELPVGPTGNFLLPGREAPLVFPYRAKVVANGKVREMAKPRSSGDCNSCHTENGANGAPGRIFLP